jgi:hypothetical protein
METRLGLVRAMLHEKMTLTEGLLILFKKRLQNNITLVPAPANRLSRGSKSRAC